MKKITALCLGLCLLLAALTGCSKQEEEPSSQIESTPAPVTEQEPFEIGLVQYVQHAALDTVRENFMSRLEERGYDDTKVEITCEDAQGDEAKLAEICQGFVEEEVDLIAAISTPAAKAAMEAAQGTDVTVIFAAVSDPQEDLGIMNPETPSGNVTGVSSQTDVTKTVDLAKQATPAIQTLGLLHSGEGTASAAAAQAKTYAESLGLTVVEKPFSSGEELPQAVADLCAQADAILTANDSLVAASAEAVAQAAREAGKPWYASGDGQLVQQGALAGVSVDYAQVGSSCADLVVERLAGRPVKELPVVFFSEPQTWINQAAQTAVGVEFPQELLDTANYCG